jgi:hypothetical protein
MCDNQKRRQYVSFNTVIKLINKILLKNAKSFRFLALKHEEQGKELELQTVKKTKREMKRVKVKFTTQIVEWQ